MRIKGYTKLYTSDAIQKTVLWANRHRKPVCMSIEKSAPYLDCGLLLWADNEKPRRISLISLSNPEMVREHFRRKLQYMELVLLRHKLQLSSLDSLFTRIRDRFLEHGFEHRILYYFLSFDIIGSLTYQIEVKQIGETEFRKHRGLYQDLFLATD